MTEESSSESGDALRFLSYRVTVTSRAVTPFDEEHGSVEAASNAAVQDDTTMSYTFDGSGGLEALRIDPRTPDGKPGTTAYLMDFSRNTYQVLNKTTGRSNDALVSLKSTLSQLVDRDALLEASRPMNALSLSTFEAQSQGAGYQVSARSKSRVSFTGRSRSSRGDTLTTLSFDPSTKLLQEATTFIESGKFTSKGSYTFTYQTVRGKPFPRAVQGRTTIEMKNKQVYGKITMPSAKLLKPGEALQLKPGEFVASEFTSPLRPGINDTSIFTYETSTEYRDVQFR